MFSILHLRMQASLLIKPELHGEIGAIDVNQRFWLLNQLSVDII